MLWRIIIYCKQLSLYIKNNFHLGNAFLKNSMALSFEISMFRTSSWTIQLISDPNRTASKRCLISLTPLDGENSPMATLKVHICSHKQYLVGGFNPIKSTGKNHEIPGNTIEHHSIHMFLLLPRDKAPLRRNTPWAKSLGFLPKSAAGVRFFGWDLVVYTVDGRNPAPPGMYKALLNNGINMDKLPGDSSARIGPLRSLNTSCLNKRNSWGVNSLVSAHSWETISASNACSIFSRHSIKDLVVSSHLFVTTRPLKLKSISY